MKLADRRLVREIAIVLAVKLALLTALWWVFVREARVAVDPREMEIQLTSTASQDLSPPLTPSPTTGETHGQ